MFRKILKNSNSKKLNILVVICLTLKKISRPKFTLESLVLLSWFVIPFIILSVGVNKDFRFLAPSIPAVGILIAWLYNKALPKKISLYLFPIFLAFPIFVFLYTSFDLGNKALQYKNWILH